MPISLTVILVAAAQAYLTVGLITAAVFLVFGIERLDAGAHGSYVFRALLVPGLTLLWPVVVVRWIGSARDSGSNKHASRHVSAWIALAVFVPLILIAGAVERHVSYPLATSIKTPASEVRP